MLLMSAEPDDLELLAQVIDIFDQSYVAKRLNETDSAGITRETINRWMRGKSAPSLTAGQYRALQGMLPQPPAGKARNDFRFIDLFAGIGGLRRAFEGAGGQCVFTSEWNKYAVKTYKANFYNDPESHNFNSDIRDVTFTRDNFVSEDEAYARIDSLIPDHEVLVAGFPCQPFSIAGVSKKNALGRLHGFECTTQGTLFFDVARILAAKQPAAFLLENVKNLKSHDKGQTFRVIAETLDELGYWVADIDLNGPDDPKILDARNFVPQHRERIVLIGFRKDLNVHEDFTLRDIKKLYPRKVPRLGDLLDPEHPKYVLTEKLWKYLYDYAIKHKKKGNGFGFGLFGPESEATRTLSARYYKDGSEVLIDRGWDMNKEFHENDISRRPRRLTPRECARLMGFDRPGKSNFVIPVSDTQAYKQFGNSVVVPVFEAVAKMMAPRVIQAMQVATPAGQGKAA